LCRFQLVTQEIILAAEVSHPPLGAILLVLRLLQR
jgi:hypothetical protein